MAGPQTRNNKGNNWCSIIFAFIILTLVAVVLVLGIVAISNQNSIKTELSHLTQIIEEMGTVMTVQANT